MERSELIGCSSTAEWQMAVGARRSILHSCSYGASRDYGAGVGRVGKILRTRKLVSGVEQNKCCITFLGYIV